MKYILGSYKTVNLYRQYLCLHFTKLYSLRLKNMDYVLKKEYFKMFSYSVKNIKNFLLSELLTKATN